MTRLLVLAAVLASTTPSPQQTRSERRPSQLVIDVVAVDKGGSPIADLGPKDLEVWISGRRVPIDYLTAVTPADDRVGRNLVLILDDVTLRTEQIPRVREAARRFVLKMGQADRMTIVSLTGRLANTTDDRGKLLNAISAYNLQLSGVTRLDILGEQFLRALSEAAREQDVGADRRTTVVGIGAGWLFEAPLPPPGVGADLHDVWTEAMRSMAFANAVFYAIDPGGVLASMYAVGSNGFSRESGGRAFVSTNDITGAVDTVMREAGTYYLVGVTDPPFFRNADLRELDVRSLRSGVTIRARRAIPGRRGEK